MKAFQKNLSQEVPKHAVKACATSFKHIVKPQTHHFKNFGGTGKSNVNTGVHFKLSGSGGGATATATTFGPFDILETGARRHVILPKDARGITRSGKTRTRRGAESIVRRRLEKGRKFRSLETGVSTLKQKALLFNGRYTPYVHHPGTRAHHPWAKSLAVFAPKSEQIFERSVLIGMARTLR